MIVFAMRKCDSTLWLPHHKFIPVESRVCVRENNHKNTRKKQTCLNLHVPIQLHAQSEQECLLMPEKQPFSVLLLPIFLLIESFRGIIEITRNLMIDEDYRNLFSYPASHLDL